MSSAYIIFNQLIKMAIYCAIGYVLHKKKMITREGCRAFSTLLLYVILPCVLISSFFRETSADTTRKLLISLIAGVILVLVSILISKALYRQNAVDEFSSSFSNAGFMGMPLVAAAYGNDAVFYIAGFTALLNILQWTYGQHLLSREEKVSFRGVALNPLVISFLIGIVCYFLPIELPEQISSCVSAVAACNSPVAMIILGYYLSEIPFKVIVSSWRCYLVTFGRLIAIPVVSIFVLKLIPEISVVVKEIMLIAACAPVGINVAIYAQRLGKDYHRAVTLICQSTVFCIVTMPFIIWLSSLIF